jgi:hypothetical protein
MIPLALVSHPFIAQLSNQLITVIALVGGLMVAVIVSVTAIYFHHRKNQLWHETARIALEKGQPVPPMPLRDEELELRPPPGVSFAEWHEAKLVESRTHAFRGGLVLLGVGAGLVLMMPPGSNALGAIPGFIGVALIVNALIERCTARKPKRETQPPPA